MSRKCSSVCFLLTTTPSPAAPAAGGNGDLVCRALRRRLGDRLLLNGRLERWSRCGDRSRGWSLLDLRNGGCRGCHLRGRLQLLGWDLGRRRELLGRDLLYRFHVLLQRRLLLYCRLLCRCRLLGECLLLHRRGLLDDLLLHDLFLGDRWLYCWLYYWLCR